MDETPKGPAKVGYGRPPEHTRFKPNQSGNPKGRPRGSKNLATEIEAALNERTAITENGKRKKIQKRKIIAKQVVNKAAAGDHKATTIVVQHDRIQQATPAAKDGPAEVVSTEDRRVMESFISRMLAMRNAAAEIPARGELEDPKPKTSKERKQ